MDSSPPLLEKKKKKNGEEEEWREKEEEKEELMSSSSSRKEKWDRLVTELEKDLKLAGPMIFSLLSTMAMSSSNQMFAGHLGSLDLSAVALSSSVVGNLASGVMTGLVSAQETLCGQAFGAGQTRLLSIYLQRSWIILITAAFIISPLYIFNASILKLFGQNEQIADLAGKFSVRIIPQLFGQAMSAPTQKFLQTQRKITVLAWIGLLALVVHVGLLWLFVSVLGWGFDGLTLAYNISGWVIPLAHITYIMGWCKDTWFGLSSSAFREIWPYLRLSIASAMQIFVGALFSIVLILLIGHLNGAVLAVGAFSICMNAAEWVTMVGNGMSVASSVRVSNELGSGRHQAAKYAMLVTTITSLAIGIICAATVLVMRNQFAILFTNDKELQKTVADSAYFLAVIMVTIGLQTSLIGAAVGAGLQVLIAYISFTTSYIIGIPLVILCGYILQMGLKGVWIGVTSGMVLQMVGSVIILWKTNWKKEATRAITRVQSYAVSDTTNA